ncbi:hypothetical protein XELAEV_18016330mg [Xenopus laevis]|uniref:Uncharacterized protein n=1 Tax=Xenopus laevis TaxID=8355 RepID=A0A974DJS0_XENLA|nr:hypothetical protein XELAEV_18016330mg [Xenopus laevis]
MNRIGQSPKYSPTGQVCLQLLSIGLNWDIDTASDTLDPLVWQGQQMGCISVISFTVRPMIYLLWAL